MKILVLLILTAALGCSTIHYETKVVKKAREYVLEKMPELSEKAKFRVKYTPPRIMQKRLISRSDTVATAKNDVMQTCVVWANPDEENTYIVVSGVSEKRLDDWYPNRLLIKSGDDWEIEEAPKTK